MFSQQNTIFNMTMYERSSSMTTRTTQTSLANTQTPSTATPSTTETLLFNDIINEKAGALRDLMTEFLQVYPYRKFDAEFSTFLRRLKLIINDARRNGAHESRYSNTSNITQIAAHSGSSEFTNRPTSLRRLQGSCSPVRTINPFKPPTPDYHRTVFIPSTNHSNRSLTIRKSLGSRSVEVNGNNLGSTFVEVNKNDLGSTSVEVNRNVQGPAVVNDVNKNNGPTKQPKIPSPPQTITPPSTVTPPTTDTSPSTDTSPLTDTSPSTVIPPLLQSSKTTENVSVPDIHLESIEDNTNTTISPLQQLRTADTIKATCVNQHNQVMNKEIKYLSKWSANIKPTSTSDNSIFVIIITGTLLAEDKVTVIEKNHKSGILISRKEKNLVKTNKGLYNLISPIVGGSPNNFYKACVEINGIPKNWNSFLTNYSNTKKLYTSLSLNQSMTRSGTVFNNSKIIDDSEYNNKRKLSSKNNSSLNKKYKRNTIVKELSQASASKVVKKEFGECKTPRQFLQYRFHRKFVKACGIVHNINKVNNKV